MTELSYSEKITAQRNALIDAIWRLGENSWYSKDPKWWAAVDRRSLEELRNMAAALREELP